MMYTSQELLEKIGAYLKTIAKDRTPKSLYEPIEYVLSLGGKRIRPTLMLLAYNMYKENPDEILPQACGLETYHNYTLLHDDLMDKADLRRGHKTVHKKWDDNTAILSGDSMLVLAYQEIAKCNHKKLKDVLQIFTETALQIGEGQQYDMDFEHRNDVTENEYIEMIRLKTSVLLACALKIGGILGEASPQDADLLYKFGEQIGLAFQLQDDFLDVYGDTKVFGKAIGGDILCNKKTYMLINAYNRANKEQRDELKKWITLKVFDPKEKIQNVTHLYNEIGIDKLAKEKIDYYFEESKKYIDAIDLPEEKKIHLKAYAMQMMKRKY